MASKKIEDNQKLDTSVDRNLANDQNSNSIFIKVIGLEMYHSSSGNLYLRCWVDCATNAVGNEAPHFVDLGLPAINVSVEVNIFGTHAIRMRRLTDGYHWPAPDHVLEKLQRLE